MGHSKNKVGVIQFTILTIVSMTDGIIMIPTLAAGVGAISLYAWITTTLGAVILACAFAKCGRFNKKSGGLGGYAEYGFGKAGNFLANYTYAISLMIANVGIAISVVSYASSFFNAQLSTMQVIMYSALILILTAAAVVGGTSFSVKMSSLSMMLQMVPVLIISMVGLFFFKPDIFSAAWNPHHYTLVQTIGLSNSFTLWAFLGLESACSNMERVKNPERNVPIAVIKATVAIGVFSILYATVIQGIVPNAVLAQSNAPFGDACAYMFGPEAGHVVTALMIFGCGGALIAWQFTLVELLRAGAQEGYFPKVFGRVNAYEIPVRGIAVMLLIQMMLLSMTGSPSMVAQFDALIKLSTVANLVPYVLAMASLDIMQRQAGKDSDLTRMAAVAGGAYSIFACIQCGMDSVTYGMVAVLVGLMIYGLYAVRLQTPYRSHRMR